MAQKMKYQSYDWKKRFSDTAELLPNIICEVDTKGYLTWVNRIGLDCFRYTAEQFDEGVHLSRIIHPDDLDEGMANVQALLDGKQVGLMEYRMVHSDGSWAVYEVNSAPIYEGDRIVGIRTSLFDVSERKEAQEKARRKVKDLREEVRQKFSFENMVSRSGQMRKIFDTLPPIADVTTTVLIYGASGTGKELVARAIHGLSPRSEKNFVAINCGALPDNLLESELFGYKAGAFTDARKDKPGKFALAEGGVIFLDEIGDISPAMQVKLLRVLQERVYEPLGGTSSIKTDVRVIAATNRDLPAMIQEGAFREDLFYRLNVLKITLPPLRERRSDIPILCDHFVSQFNRRFGKSVEEVSPEVMETLLAHDYPGNIRELENIIEHAFVFCHEGVIMPKHLPEELSGIERTGKASGLAAYASFAELEADYLRAVLDEVGGNRLEAANRLGIHKSTLFRKLKSLGISEE